MSEVPATVGKEHSSSRPQRQNRRDPVHEKEEGETKPHAKQPQKQQKGKQQNAGGGQGGHQAQQSSNAHTNDGQLGSQKQRQSRTPTLSRPRMALFDHLPRKANQAHSSIRGGINSLHPAIIRLGELFNQGIIQTDDDRVVSLLAAFEDVITEYTIPPNKTLSRDLDKHIRVQVQFLVENRQLSVGMGNVIKLLRHDISKIPPDTSEADAKSYLLNELRAFVEERIGFAKNLIANNCISTIEENDTILTYGNSSVVREVLLTAAKTKTFRLVMVDSRPLNDGLITLKCLPSHIACTYTSISGASSAIEEVTQVILGASAVLSNGAVIAPAGTAMVAALAKTRRVPVVIAAESYKFCEKVQLDSIVFNELGSELEVVSFGGGEEAQGSGEKTEKKGKVNVRPNLEGGYLGGATGAFDDETMPFQVVNLRYDLTPISSVSVVATEIGLIPPSSIPVLIRDLRLDD
jgi:translation initiation factor eIF-2B subunit delta